MNTRRVFPLGARFNCPLFGRGKEHEVEKMFTLKSGRVPPADVKNVIFFVRPRLELMDIIVDNVLRSVRTPQPGSPAAPGLKTSHV